MYTEKNKVLAIEKDEAENTTENVTPDESDLLKFLCGSLAVLWKDWPRDMDVTILDKDKNKFSLIGTCPHCLRSAVFMMVTNAHSVLLATYTYRLCAAMQCQGCLKFILGVVRKGQITWEYEEHYPLGKPDDSVSTHVPASIASDFSEALRCFWVRSYKATVAMCRRSVEASCADLKAKGKNLKDKIDGLANEGIITEPLKRMAHRVRLTANEELHGKADDLDEFSEKEAEAILTCVREYFHHVYVMPALLKAYDEPDT